MNETIRNEVNFNNEPSQEGATVNDINQYSRLSHLINSSDHINGKILKDALNSKDSAKKITLEQYAELVGMLNDKNEAIIDHIADVAMHQTGAAEELRELVLRDSLTGISNRRALDKELAEATTRLNTQNETGNEKRKSDIDYILFSVIDVNKFKYINDTYGHNKGDEALKLIASCLEDEATERGAKAARYGGDEFAMIQEGVGNLSPDEIQSISLRIQEKINTRLALPVRDGSFSFTISVGTAIMKAGEDKNSDQLKKEADDRMYESKNNTHSG